jgi:hypothetical protein
MKYIIFNFLLVQIISQSCESINDCRDYTEANGVCESVYKICSPIITVMDYVNCAKYIPNVKWDDNHCTCEDGYTLSQDKGACFISLLSNSECGSQGFEKDCEYYTNSECKNGKCVCKSGYKENSEGNSCEYEETNNDRKISISFLSISLFILLLF